MQALGEPSSAQSLWEFASVAGSPLRTGWVLGWKSQESPWDSPFVVQCWSNESAWGEGIGTGALVSVLLAEPQCLGLKHPCTRGHGMDKKNFYRREEFASVNILWQDSLC